MWLEGSGSMGCHRIEPGILDTNPNAELFSYSQFSPDGPDLRRLALGGHASRTDIPKHTPIAIFTICEGVSFFRSIPGGSGVGLPPAPLWSPPSRI